MSEPLMTGAKRSFILIQPGGAGYDFVYLDYSQKVDMSAPQQGVKPTQYKRESTYDGDVVVGVETTGFVADSTFDLAVNVDKHAYLSEWFGGDDIAREAPLCSKTFNLRLIREYCEQPGGEGYDFDYGMMAMMVTTNNAFAFGQKARDAMEGQNLIQTITAPYKAATLQREVVPVQTRVSTAETLTISHVVYDPRTERVWCVRDSDGTANNMAVGHMKWYDPGFTFVPVNTGTVTGTPTALKLANGYVYVADDDTGIHQASVRDVVNSVATPFVLGGGWASATEFPNDVAFVGNSKHGFAVGTGGYIWETKDGQNWTEFSAGTVTANDLNTLAIASDYLWYAGGASGTFVRYRDNAANTVTISGLTDAILTVAVPRGRPDFVAIGTDAGEYIFTRNGNDPVVAPSFTSKSFYDSANAASIPKIAFYGLNGQYMYVLVTNSTPATRLLIDPSGGAMSYAMIVGSYAGNSGINDIAIRRFGDAFLVGAPNSGTSYIGKLSVVART